MSRHTNKILEAENRKHLFITVLFITLLGAVIRLIGAWWMRITPNGDSARYSDIQAIQYALELLCLVLRCFHSFIYGEEIPEV